MDEITEQLRREIEAENAARRRAMAEAAAGESAIPTPWAVLCPVDRRVYLTAREYHSQMMRPDSLWKCPRCGQTSEWDDYTYDAAMDAAEEG